MRSSKDIEETVAQVRIGTEPRTDQIVLGHLFTLLTKTHRRRLQQRRTATRHWAPRLAAAAGVIVVALAGMHWLGSGTPAYGITEALGLWQNARTVHVQGHRFLHTGDEQLQSFPFEWWLDREKGCYRYYVPMDWFGDYTTDPQYSLGISDGSFILKAYRRENRSWGTFRKLSPYAQRLQARTLDPFPSFMHHPNHVTGFGKVASEQLAGRMTDVWEGQITAALKSVPFTRWRIWLSPSTGRIMRLKQWTNVAEQDNSVRWLLAMDADTIEYDVTPPADCFNTDPPEGYEMDNTKATAVAPDLGQYWGNERFYTCVGFTLDDGSVILGWHANHEPEVSQASFFADLKPTGPLPQLPARIVALKPWPVEEDVTLQGRHLAWTEKKGKFYEWGLYVPGREVPDRFAFQRYKVISEFDGIEPRAFGGRPISVGNDVAIASEAEFDTWVRGAMAELSDDGIAPAHVTYEHVATPDSANPRRDRTVASHDNHALPGRTTRGDPLSALATWKWGFLRAESRYNGSGVAYRRGRRTIEKTMAGTTMILDKLREAFERGRGQWIESDLKRYRKTLARIDMRGREIEKFSDRQLKELSDDLIARARAGVSLDDLLIEAYALAREVSSRVLGMRHFDVQVLGGIAMHQGKLIEMQTGEGKTLAAVLPAYLNALAGQGVHVLTFNDYLARRDAGWMGPVYEFLGLTVGFIQEGMPPSERQQAYRCDITYATAKEAGFDLLRDHICTDPNNLVHRAFHVAMVDEADSILIDEARIPLVIAGSTDEVVADPYEMADFVRELTGGMHYETDENDRNVYLTESGLDQAERILGCDNLHAQENLLLVTQLHLALHAHVLLHRDVDYIVREGKVKIVDEFTGRVVEDRHWPHGLQAAVEAKEGLNIQAEGIIRGSITLIHLARLYPKLCGMTATAQGAAEEFGEFYRIPVVVIPPHKPCIRTDASDMIFATKDAKRAALVEEIATVRATGRPILVGTCSVAESEELATALEKRHVPCRVLNAKNDELEAEIVAEAGAPRAVTISTNMAGRGTDIRLGGKDERYHDEMSHVRDGIHLMASGARDPLDVYHKIAGKAFCDLLERIDDSIVETFAAVEVTADGIDVVKAGLKGPSSTWTYLINDHPFGDWFGRFYRTTAHAGDLVRSLKRALSDKSSQHILG